MMDWLLIISVLLCAISVLINCICVYKMTKRLQPQTYYHACKFETVGDELKVPFEQAEFAEENGEAK